MSGVRNTIEMLRLLHSHRLIKRQQLADILETNVRNIAEYKDTLVDAGYSVLSKPGRYGGYYLDERNILKTPALTKEEQTAIYDLHKVLYLDHSYVGASDTFKALEKICGSFNKIHDLNDISIVQTKSVTHSEVDLDDIYTTLRYAITKQFPVIIRYASTSKSSFKTEDLKEKTLKPYDLVRVDSNWYAVMFDTTVSKFKRYRLNRLRSIELITERFWHDPKYKLSDHIDENGLTNTGTEARVKLKVTAPYILGLKENPIGINVTYEEHDTYMIYEADIRGDYKISELILKMGAHCTVLGPENIKESIQDKIKEMFLNYNN